MATSMKINFRSLLPGNYMTIQQNLAHGIWPWTKGRRARLPHHYKLRYIEKHMREPVAVHYKVNTQKYWVDKHGQWRLVQNVPVPLVFPNEVNKGLWGGEAFLLGYRRRREHRLKPHVWRMWKLFLMHRVLYSEILDKWLMVTVTPRTLDLVDQVQGLDRYILATHEVDQCSQLGMKLKQLLLKMLHEQSLYPNDPAKREKILQKYSEYLIPKEEIEWLGLTIEQVERKQDMIEEEEYQARIKPMKLDYMDELIELIKQNKLPQMEEQSSDKGLVDKVSDWNPFKSAN